MEKDLKILNLGKEVNYIYSRNKERYSFKKIENSNNLKNKKSFKELENELKKQGIHYDHYITMLPEHNNKIIDVDKIATNESKIGVINYNKLKVLYPKISSDGIYTEDPTKGIILCPADCMAIGIFDIKRKSKALLYSGWKGILGEIVIKGLSISKKNFIVKEDIIDLFNEFIKQRLGENKEFYICKQNKNSYNVDLRQILIKTLYNRGIKKEQILSIEEDTYSAKQNEKYIYHSYRRDKELSRRNIVMI